MADSCGSTGRSKVRGKGPWRTGREQDVQEQKYTFGSQLKPKWSGRGETVFSSVISRVVGGLCSSPLVSI